MKGYELILLAAGLTVALVASLTLLNGTTILDQGRACADGNTTRCERQVIVGEGTFRVFPFLAASAVLLVGVALGFVLYRRWYRPPEPVRDEGPPYREA